MEIINPCFEEFQSEKVCRLCGSDNKENIDIFTSKPISSRSEDLLTKILTVYPLVLYKDDPLPQHICPKCIGNVSTTYQDIQQVMRQQKKWMSLRKAMQPEHKYFRILNIVENSIKATKETIKTSYNIDINNIPLGKLLATPSRENQNNNAIKANNKDNINENVVQNIQNKLESNGFTIKRIKIPTSTNNYQDLKAVTDSVNLINNELGTSANVVTCNYCAQKFSDLKILAQHQLIHLNLSANKIFQKHLLPKQLRRGRLITLNDNKCIRCLNCWRVYNDNKTILQHWSEGECEFYCFICGKEFPHSPKMLREHITDNHGISYRSVKNEFMTSHSQHTLASLADPAVMPTNDSAPAKLNPIVKKPVYKKPPPKSCTKNADGTITCKICHKVFDNFRSSNSHMRKHKPPTRHRESVNTTSLVVDKYNTEKYYEAQPSTSNTFYRNATATNHLQIKPNRPPHHVFMKNDALRGIKTKIVQNRQDFLTNHTTGNRHPAQNSMASTTKYDENLIVPELLTSPMKSQGDSPKYDEYTNNPLTQIIKSEPLDDSDYVTQEPSLCFICNESFSSSHDYELHAMFVHNIN